MKFTIFALFLGSLFLSSCSTFLGLIAYSPSPKVRTIHYAEEATQQDYRFLYSDTMENSYLRKLRQDYGLDTLAANTDDDLEKIIAILHWSSSQWEHNGSNTPSNPDALTILEEARTGQQFRCVEYGILASAGLNAVGIPARPLGLKTRDVARVKSGAGHVVTEAYSSGLGKWIFMDPQLDLIPVLDGIPLDAVEFQRAIASGANVELINSEGVLDADFRDSYLRWLGKYLYFLEVPFDSRIGEEAEILKFDGKPKLMLVPLGEDNPEIFQRKYSISYCVYTHSLADFYQVPGK